ncbi:M24 family metallopeptidase [Corynebacterium sp. 335C]
MTDHATAGADAATARPDFAARRAALAAALPEAGCDALVVTHPAHVAWLTGFSGSNGAVLVDAREGAEPAVISTDGRYTVQVAAQAPDLRCVDARACGTALIADLLEREKTRDDGASDAGDAADAAAPRIGFEAGHVTVAAAGALREAAGGELVEVTDVVEKLRAVKDDVELDLLRRAAEIAVDAFAALTADGCIRAGVTEREVAAELEYRMRVRGADGPSFDTIVASGPNSAKPHHGAEDRVLEEGDLVTVDFGALANGYCSDMTRTVAVGGADAADDFSREIHSVVLRAQLAGVEAARPGAKLTEVDAACRDVIVAAGYGEYFVHSTGHGIGVDVHEFPYAAVSGTGVLEPGMTLTIEPGIYVPGRGGVRIEDTLVITDGDPENLVPLPKTL